MKSKKIFSLIICMIMCLIPVFGNVYASTSYNLGIDGYSVSIPDDMYVFTKDTPADYEGFDHYGVEYDSMMYQLQIDNQCLYAMEKDGYSDFSLSIASPTISTAGGSAAECIDEIISAEKTSFKSGDVDVSSEIFKSSSGVEFVKVTCSSGNSGRISYVALYNGKQITARYTTHDSLTSQNQTYAATLVNSMTFPEADSDKEPAENTEDKKPQEPDEDKPVANPSLNDDDSSNDETNADSADGSGASENDQKNGNSQSSFDGTMKTAVIILGALVIILLFVMIFGKKNRRQY